MRGSRIGLAGSGRELAAEAAPRGTPDMETCAGSQMGAN